MTKNESSSQKRIVEELNFSAKTSKRVSWEQFEFTIESPYLVRVTNASYGFEKDDHSYLVGVEERDGLLTPAECECPADKYNDEYDCKHKVALATVGGPIVLNAAVDYPTPTVDTEQSNTSTLADKLRADGGTITEETPDESTTLDERNHSECDCTDFSRNFPCWSCVRDGERDLPE